SGKGRPKDGESEKEFAVRSSEKIEKFKNDHRHTLYREYLKIIAAHWPSVFVMENVKGILSSRHNGELIFPTIRKDLENPAEVFPSKGKSHKYKIHSLVVQSKTGEVGDLQPKDFLIKAEDYGIPQKRHRVILIGIRDNVESSHLRILKKVKEMRNVTDVIGDLPRLTPGLSKGKLPSPFEALKSIRNMPWWNKLLRSPEYGKIAVEMELGFEKCLKQENRGNRFLKPSKTLGDEWYADAKLHGVCNHETRSHIAEDLWRYYFSAVYAKKLGISAHLRNFPKELYPKHRNVEEAVKGTKFGDRFRVQLKNQPATTVISHISKDGHYFIHYDPEQYRSLTVREAARIQTFPDNYFFEGPRTKQFHQVGNAVPPKLAYKISEIVSEILG
ncbi:DNA cytosine methyltransferase, partial [Verrucomicrobiales bacterium]|nr:DNA cytosine methyltransferase [Verrucomicrobiales bacterium]